MLVKDFDAAWAARFPRPSLETTRHNELMLRPFVRRHGRVHLGTVSDELAARYVRDYPSHARYAQTFMEDARRARLIDRNPFEHVPIPRRAPDERQPLTESLVWDCAAAARELWPGAFGVRFSALIATSAFSGIRGGGAASLREPDVDAVSRPWRLHVREKGDKPREVTLAPQRACEALSEALSLAGGGLVFLSVDGRPLNRWSWGRAFSAVKAEVGLPDDVTWKSLRRFCASWMIDRGAQPIDVALQLHGRTDPDVVLRYYVRASRESSFERLAELCA